MKVQVPRKAVLYNTIQNVLSTYSPNMNNLSWIVAEEFASKIRKILLSDARREQIWGNICRERHGLYPTI